MKRLLIFLGVLMVAGTAKAADPVFLSGWNSAYEYTNSTVAVSSVSAGTFSAVDGYRQITLEAANSYYLVLDGTTSTATIATSGFLVAANTRERLESNAVIRILLTPGTPNATIRYIQRRK